MKGTYYSYYARYARSIVPRYLTRYRIVVQRGLGQPYITLKSDFREYWQASTYAEQRLFCGTQVKWLDYSKGIKALYKGRIFHVREYQIPNPNFKE